MAWLYRAHVVSFLFAHPIKNREFTPGERAWMIYVAESVQRVKPSMSATIVKIGDGQDSDGEMVYVLDVRWDFPEGEQRFNVGRSGARGVGLTPGAALSNLLESIT